MTGIHRATRVVAAAAIFALAGARGSAAPIAEAGTPDPLWTAVAASGRVESTTTPSCSATWSRLSRGSRLPALTRVRTLERSRATLTRGGDIVLVSARSEVTLPDQRTGPDTVIRQSSGRALYQFEPRREGRVEIATPYLVAGVKGTVFSVIVDSEFTSVGVVSGHVEVTSLSGEAVDLFSGDLALFDVGEGSLRVFRDRADETDLTPVDLSQSARQSRKETGQLVRAADADTLTWEAKETDLWNDIADERWLDNTRENALDADPLPMKEDQVVIKVEEDTRNILCLAGLKCR